MKLEYRAYLAVCSHSAERCEATLCFGSAHCVSMTSNVLSYIAFCLIFPFNSFPRRPVHGLSDQCFRSNTMCKAFREAFREDINRQSRPDHKRAESLLDQLPVKSAANVNQWFDGQYNRNVALNSPGLHGLCARRSRNIIFLIYHFSVFPIVEHLQ